jgi:diadenosine tetraphosphatase ApaH/serine/threonine PP2A family protein phosphatase
MKYLVLADVHSNLEALKAVLGHARSAKFKRLLVLGDSVGYYSQPNQVLNLFRQEKDALVLMGNHDAAAAGEIPLEGFNPEAGQAIEWTRKRLTPENLAYLKGLPYFFSNEFLFACHASPKDYLWEYMDSQVAKASLESITERLLLVGHVHEAFVYRKGDKVARFIPGDESIDFSVKRTVVSLPSVGQPRDGNPQAGYAVLDLDNQVLEIKRLDYDFKTVQVKTTQAGLSKWNADRLSVGR